MLTSSVGGEKSESTLPSGLPPRANFNPPGLSGKAT